MSPDLEQFIEEEVASGRFTNRDELIAHAVRLRKMERDECIAGVNDGLEDFENGRVWSVKEAFDSIRNELGLPRE